MVKEYGISKEMMDNYQTKFNLNWLTRLKFWLFGREIVEFAGPWKYRYYVYRGVLYLVDIRHKYS